jgi:hypothetical protein
MKQLIVVLCILMTTSLSFAVREVQNGGSGLKVDGGFLTYYSAQGTYRQPVEVSDRVPGLDLLIKEIITLPLDSWNKLEILKYFDFTKDRKYFRLTQAQLTEDLREKIIQDYATMMNVPPQQVVIFALTNPATLSTVLLPEFFNLRPEEQAALIVHESMWLTKDATYERVITAEQITQAYLDDRNDAQKYYRFVNMIHALRGDALFKIKAGLDFDIRMKRLSPAVVYARRMKLTDFLNSEEIRGLLCPTHPDPEYYGDISREIYFRSRLNYRKKNNSLFFTAFYEFLENRGQISIHSMVDCQNTAAIAKFIDSAIIDLSQFRPGPSVSLRILNSDNKDLGQLNFLPPQ